MVQRGAENANHNGIAQVSFYSQDLTKIFRTSLGQIKDLMHY